MDGEDLGGGSWGEASSMGIQGVGVPNRSRRGAATSFSITSLIMYLVYHSLSVNFTLLIPSTESIKKMCFLPYLRDVSLSRFGECDDVGAPW